MTDDKDKMLTENPRFEMLFFIGVAMLLAVFAGIIVVLGAVSPVFILLVGAACAAGLAAGHWLLDRTKRPRTFIR